jgi:DNA-binding NarL/FixJ family response regulator
MVVIGETADGSAALRRAHTHASAVALLDIAMPHMNGLETGRRLREAVPQSKTILLTIHTDEPSVCVAL